MAVILGAATLVSVGIVQGGVTSIDWSYSPNIQRFYVLGQAQAAFKSRGSDVQINFAVYGKGDNTPGTSKVNLEPTAGSCADSPAKTIVAITPAVCGPLGASSLPSTTVYLNSYSYNKDRQGYGQEQWSGTAYVQASDLQSGEYAEPLPKIVVLGISEGNIECETTSPDQSLVGAELYSVPTPQFKGSVQASQNSIGEGTWVYTGEFKSVGGSTMYAPSTLAKASVTMPHQPVYWA